MTTPVRDRTLPTLVSRAHGRAMEHLKAWPLTWRLIAVMVVLVMAALALTTLGTQLVLRSYLLDRTDAELATAGTAAADNSLSSLATTGHVTTPTVPSSYVLVITDATGTTRRGFASPDAQALPNIPALGMTDPRVTSGEPFTVHSARVGGDDWRVLAGPLNDRSGTYAVGLPLRGIDDTLTRLRVLSLFIGLAIVAVCATVGYGGIKRAFRPLRQIEDTAAAIADGDLTRRVPEHAAQDEVASLSRSLNAMLAQVETSFTVREASEERMRRFVTDASHELRTPLATIRGYAELYRQGAASSPEDIAGAMRRIEDEATRMSGLVEDLLTLARLDNRRPLDLTDVDLTVLAGDAVQDAKARDPGRPLRLMGLDSTPLRPTLVRGDEGRLRQVITNLVANALQHTPAGSPIEVVVGRVAAGPGAAAVRLEVRDHGPGIAEADVDRVFQRFYRGDPSRGRSSGGSGLGLAIVMAIVAAHSGRVGVRSAPGSGATFVVELPIDSREGPAPPPHGHRRSSPSPTPAPLGPPTPTFEGHR